MYSWGLEEGLLKLTKSLGNGHEELIWTGPGPPYIKGRREERKKEFKSIKSQLSLGSIDRILFLVVGTESNWIRGFLSRVMTL